MSVRLSVVVVFLSVAAFSQPVQDSTVNKLEEVVITGQIEPQSLRKSVHNVRVITRADISQLAANNLADVLNQYLNISIVAGGSDGRSSVSLFGLDSQYFKILIDNIPLVSDTGLGNNIDLTQVNLDDIEQIEIIEGSMGVTHGANAVTGILNIITRKKADNQWEITATVQEETVSDEFALFDRGRHIQSARISHRINNRWFVTLGGNRNDFAGYYDNRKGEEHRFNDGLRGHSWLPKEQLSGNATIGYQKPGFRFFYKFDYYNEEVDFFNPVVIPQDNYPFPETYFSNDRRYLTSRFYHHANAYGNIGRVIFNLSASYQSQDRDLEKYNYQLETGQEFANDRQTYQAKEVMYSTGTFSNFFKEGPVGLQLGYEIVNESGFYDASAGMFRDETQETHDVSKRFENYDIFSIAEIRLTDQLSVRPGLRYSFQSRFDNQYAASLGIRYLFSQGIEARLSGGTSFRTPNFDELYTYFVDSNHNVQGSPHLIPETSTTVEAHLKKTTYTGSAKIFNSLSATFLDVNDKISLVIADVDPTIAYQYLNIDSHKMWNIATTNQLTAGDFDLSAGAALIGISQQINLGALDATSKGEYLYTVQANASASYRVPSTKTVFSLYYKYNGKQQQYLARTDTGNNVEFVLSELEPYSWMDASVRQAFLEDKLEVVIGARNLLDVRSARLSQTNNTGIHTSGSDVLLGYGRSVFIKLSYNLNIN